MTENKMTLSEEFQRFIEGINEGDDLWFELASGNKLICQHHSYGTNSQPKQTITFEIGVQQVQKVYTRDITISHFEIRSHFEEALRPRGLRLANISPLYFGDCGLTKLAELSESTLKSVESVEAVMLGYLYYMHVFFVIRLNPTTTPTTA